jgi:hypothetical protein
MFASPKDDNPERLQDYAESFYQESNGEAAFVTAFGIVRDSA